MLRVITFLHLNVFVCNWFEFSCKRDLNWTKSFYCSGAKPLQLPEILYFNILNLGDPKIISEVKWYLLVCFTSIFVSKVFTQHFFSTLILYKLNFITKEPRVHSLTSGDDWWRLFFCPLSKVFRVFWII